MKGHPRFSELLDKMHDIHIFKSLDYGNKEDVLSNLKMCKIFGVEPHMGVMVRMSDKFSRLCQLMKKDFKNDVLDEKIEDTLIDLANYSLLMIILLEEKKNEEKKG